MFYVLLFMFIILFQVILKNDGRIMLYCKGADSTVFQLLGAKSSGLKEITIVHLNVIILNLKKNLCGLHDLIWILRFHFASKQSDCCAVFSGSYCAHMVMVTSIEL